LIQDTSGGYTGASWTLAEAYAKKLGVKLETVNVSQETKVTALNTKQIDVSITPLAETPERKAAVSFVTYSATAICYAGLKSNQKVSGIKDVEGINSPSLKMAYFVGASQEHYLPERFPQLKLKGVTGSGSGVPIEELLSGRVDLVVFNTVEWPALVKRYPDLTAFPSECRDSNEQKNLIGHAVSKSDPAFVNFLTGIEKEVDSQLQAEILKAEESAS
jgi:polar amino acid transport system substrate-binding protein